MRHVRSLCRESRRLQLRRRLAEAKEHGFVARHPGIFWVQAGGSDHPAFCGVPLGRGRKLPRPSAVITLLTGPAYAQTLIQSFDDKTPQQNADQELREKFSKEQQQAKIPEADAKTSVDPWGNVRSGDAAKTKTSTSKISTSKAANSLKPRTKTGTDAD
jgi:hypothetical protein